MKRILILVALVFTVGFAHVGMVSAWNSDHHHNPKCSDDQYVDEYYHCVPKRCPYDVSLTVTDKKCVKPPVCPTNPDILQSDDKCVVTPPTPEPTPTPTPVPSPTPPTTTDTQVQVDVTPSTPSVESNDEVFTGK